MAKSNKFFKPVKQVKKELTGTLINTGIGAGSAIATAYGINKLKPMIKDPKLLKFVGGIVSLGGYALAAFASDDKLKTAGNAMGAIGAYQASLDMAPNSMKAGIQMAPAFQNETTEGFGSLSEALSDLYDQEIEGVDEDDEIEGMDEDDEIEGIDEDDEIDGLEDDEIEGVDDANDDENELADNIFDVV